MKNRVQSQATVGVNWQQVWELNILAKVRNFIWRSLTNSLPTMKALQHRQVEVPEWCPLCHSEPEDGLHALVSCPAARCIWCLTSIWKQYGSVDTLEDWWNNLIRTRTPSDIEMAAVVLWSIWHNRNEVVWNGKCRSAIQILSSALDFKSQLRLTNQRAIHSHIPQRQQPFQLWSRPPESHLKCNVDAALFLDPSSYGFWMRDKKFKWWRSGGNAWGIQNPTIAKALGIREALCCIKDLREK
ncbi:uncharacterized protein [Henckelia pumila]|uniref:uncharacterized protein n=1 Tax=Henckelia pumila TaxID=405737 RepID=UPI003C6E80EE